MTSDLLNESKAEFAGFMTQLQNLAELRQSTATSILQFSNQIFQAPAASDLFTGRIKLLSQVEEAFSLFRSPLLDATGQLTKSPDSIILSSSSSSAGIASDQARFRGNTEFSQDRWAGCSQRKQKRFILVGLGGSGKTEFCCKFAAQNQSRYSTSMFPHTSLMN